MAAIAVRMFGGPDVDCFPHNSFFYQKYSFLLQSPWASSLEQESVKKLFIEDDYSSNLRSGML